MTDTDVPLTGSVPDLRSFVRQSVSERQAALSSSASIASLMSPAKLADAAKLGREFGVDPSVYLDPTPEPPDASPLKAEELSALARKNRAMGSWLADPRHAALVKDDLPSLHRIATALRGSRDQSFLADLADAHEAGWEGITANDTLTATTIGKKSTLDAAKEYAAIQRRIAAIPTPAYVKEFQEAEEQAKETEGGILEWFMRPHEIGPALAAKTGRSQHEMMDAGVGEAALASIAAVGVEAGVAAQHPRAFIRGNVENAPFMYKPLVAGIAGAAAGAVLTGGTASVPMALAASFTGETVNEYGAWIDQELKARLAREGKSPTNEGDVLSVLSDREWMGMVQKEGLAKGIVTSAVDTAGMLLPGAAVGLRRGVGESVKGLVKRVAKELPLAGLEQAGVSLGSEGLGQGAARGKFGAEEVQQTAQEVTFGAAGEAMSKVTVGSIAKTMGMTKGAVVDLAAKVRQADRDATGANEIADAFKASPAAKRLPEALQNLIATIAGTKEVRQVWIPKPAFDAAFQGDHTSPLRAAADITKDGEKAYRDAKSGFVVLPFQDVVARLSGKPEWDALLPDMRFREKGLSVQEGIEGAQRLSQGAIDAQKAAEEAAELADEREALTQEAAELEQEEAAAVTPAGAAPQLAPAEEGPIPAREQAQSQASMPAEAVTDPVTPRSAPEVQHAETVEAAKAAAPLQTPEEVIALHEQKILELKSVMTMPSNAMDESLQATARDEIAASEDLIRRIKAGEVTQAEGMGEAPAGTDVPRETSAAPAAQPEGEGAGPAAAPQATVAGAPSAAGAGRLAEVRKRLAEINARLVELEQPAAGADLAAVARIIERDTAALLATGAPIGGRPMSPALARHVVTMRAKGLSVIASKWPGMTIERLDEAFPLEFAAGEAPARKTAAQEPPKSEVPAAAGAAPAPPEAPAEPQPAAAGGAWRPGAFTMSTGEGPKGVEATISPSGLFAVHRTPEAEHIQHAVLSHVPTGLRITTLDTEKRAQELAAKLEGVKGIDWTSADKATVLSDPAGRKAAGDLIGMAQVQAAPYMTKLPRKRPAPKAAEPASPPAAPVTTGRAYGESNKVFTADAAARAREVLRKKLNQANMGLDPELLQAGLTLAGYHIEAGARRFADFAAAMVGDLGEAVRPYLRSWYEAVRHYPGMDTTGMTPAGEVEEAPATTVEVTAQPEAPPAVTALPTVPQSGDAKADRLRAAARKLADTLGHRLRAKLYAEGQPISWQELAKLASEAFGGTMADGAFSAQDLNNAVEFAVNDTIAFLMAGPGFPAGIRRQIQDLETLAALVPTQTRRSEETVAFQQFSTPPAYAAVAAWLLKLQPHAEVLEPSAGTGNLAIHARGVGAKVHVNEIDPGRAGLLAELGFTTLTREDAEQLNNILPAGTTFDAVLMNPPFSAAGQRGVKRDITIGATHVEQALKRLRPGGRLVAIVGRGMTLDAPAFRGWWSKIRGQYTVKAAVPVSGEVYRKQGTAFGTVVLVIDSTGPTVAEPLTTQPVESLTALADVLQGVRDARPEVERPGEPAGPPTTGEAGGGLARPVRQPGGAPGGLRPGGRGPEAGPQGPAGAAGVGPRVPVAGEPGGGPAEAGGGPAAQPERPAGGGLGGAAASPRADVRPGQLPAAEAEHPPEPRVALSPVVEEQAEVAADDAAIYEEYRPQYRPFPESPPPASPLVESASMRSVRMPELHYVPKLPETARKNLADTQVEAIAYAGQAHEEILPNGERQGHMTGDGTGAGKGRVAAGIIMDNWERGRRKALWITKNTKLYEDALRDWSDIGGDSKLLFNLGKIKTQEKVEGTSQKQRVDIAAKEGIAFLTYDTLKSGAEFQPDGKYKALPGKAPRLDQLKAWLPADFDGVIIFDESHLMGNTVATKGSRGVKDAAARALAGLHLRKAFPLARVETLSATGATDVTNLSYLERLGQWGEGTAFANVGAFVGKIATGGLAAMEIVARDLKQLGLYISRTLSMKGVRYERDEHVHELTEEQVAIYNRLAEAWAVVYQNMTAALGMTNAPGRHRGHIRGQFYGTQLRFFDQILNAMQMPTILKRAHEDLAAGHAVVMQLVNHYAGRLDAAEAARAAAGEDGEETEELDIGPKDDLIQMVQRAFPVQQWEDYIDQNGKPAKRPVVDAAGNPVLNAEAVKARDRLITDLNDLKVPAGPIDLIMQEFGPERVAEVTGRHKRIIYRDGRQVIENRSPDAANRSETQAFQDDRKQILVFSMAGGTGASYHADLRAKNQRLRRHYVTQAGWVADAAIQGFGRTHRTNQKQTPEYLLFSTNVPGHKRFISSIARRIEQLGALTKGERKAGASVFNETDNLEGPYGNPAVRALFKDIVRGDVEGFNAESLTEELGFESVIDKQTGALRDKEVPEVTKFLNRILATPIERQGRWFSEFEQRMTHLIEDAIARGDLDTGMQTLKAKSVRLDDNVLVRTHDKTGAETRLLTLTATHDRPRVSWARAKGSYDLEDFFVNEKSGHVWAAAAQRNKTDPMTGRVEQVRTMYGPGGRGKEVEVGHLQAWSRAGWRPVTGEAEAQELWEKQYDETSSTRDEQVHLLTGLMLPIWDRLPDKGNVYRVTLDDRTRIIGRQIPEEHLDITLERLGVGRATIKLAPQALGEAVLGGKQATLSNGWTLQAVTVKNEKRIELRGPTFAHLANLTRAGVFEETHNYKRRWFVPTGEGMAGALAAVTKGQDIVRLQEPQSLYQAAVEPDGELREFFQASAEPPRPEPSWVTIGGQQVEETPANFRRLAEPAWLHGSFLGRTFSEWHAAANALEARQRGEQGGLELEQAPQEPGGKPPRGKLTLPTADSPVYRLTLYKDADASTLIHELGHYFFHMLGSIAEADDAPQALKDDWAKTLKWLGKKDLAALTRDDHEKLAKTFEVYNFTGKAPSEAMRRIFQAFRSFMVDVYRYVKSLGVDIDPEIAGVMDRMLATEDEIRSVENEEGAAPIQLPPDSDVTTDEQKALLKTAHDAAVERLNTQLLRDLNKRKRQERAAAVEKIRQRLEAKWNERPEAIAHSMMTKGVLPDGSPHPNLAGALKMDRAAAAEEFGKASRTYKALDRMGVLVDQGGIVPQGAAETFGANSTEQLAGWLIAAENKDKFLSKLALDTLAQENPQLMSRTERHEAAQIALNGPELTEALYAEFKSLTLADRRKAGAAERRATKAEEKAKSAKEQAKADAKERREAFASIPTLQMIRKEASMLVAGNKVGTLMPWGYLRSAGAMSTQASKAAASGKWAEAADFKHKEILNREAYRIALGWADDMREERMLAAKLSREAWRKDLIKADPRNYSFADQMYALLARFGMAYLSPEAKARRSSLSEWIKDIQADGLMVDPAPWLLREGVEIPWRELTLEQFVDVMDAARGILYAARNSLRMMTEGKDSDIKEIGLELAGAVAESKKGVPVRPEDDEPGPLAAAKDRQSARFDEGTKATTFTRMFDGGKDGGPWARHYMRKGQSAADKETGRLPLTYKEYLGLLKKHFTRKERWAMNKPIDVAGEKLTHKKLLNLAALAGSRTGRQRILFRFGKDVLDAVQSGGLLSEADVAFINERYGYFDQFFPEIAAMEAEFKGIEVKKVEAVPYTVVTREGSTQQVIGGYHPIRYIDGNALIQESDEEAYANALAGRRMGEMTKQGHTKQRMDVVLRPVDLSERAVLHHIYNVVHDLSFRPALVDMRRLLNQHAVKDAIQTYYGKHALRVLDNHLKVLGAGSAQGRSMYESMVGHMRYAAVVARLGFRTVTALKQYLGLRISINDVGLKWMVKGQSQWFASMDAIPATIRWVSEVSPHMRTRWQGGWYREVNELRANLPSHLRTKFVHAAFKLITLTQYHVDLMTFLGQYAKSLHELKESGLDEAAIEQEAITQAEEAVRRTQGSGHPVDLSMFETGSPWMRLFTTFYTDASLKLQHSRLSWARMQKNDPLAWGEFMAKMLVLFSAPAALSVIGQSMMGGKDGDDDDWLLRFARLTGAEVIDMSPWWRQASSAVLGYFGGGAPAGAAVTSELGKAAYQLAQDDGGATDAAAWKAYNTAAGLLIGYPSQVLLDAAAAYQQLDEGKIPAALVGLKSPRGGR